MIQQEIKFVLVFLVVSATASETLAGIMAWNDPQYLDAIVRNSAGEDSWKDGESPEVRQALQEAKLAWPSASDLMKRLLSSHLRSAYLAKSQSPDLDYDALGQLQLKRNAGGYMCHFKLCQLGASASSSGKRRWNPMAD